MIEGREHPSDQIDYRGKLRSLYQTVNDQPSMTVQSQGDEADIHQILQKYKQVGIIEHLKKTEIRYADISEFTDFADAQRHLKDVEGMFMELPSKVRGVFHHNVAEWLDAAHDPEKRDALVAAGFVEAPEEIVTGGRGGADGEAAEARGAETGGSEGDAD